MNMNHLRYSTSPLLTSRTPVWRSKLVVGLVAIGFAVMVMRAVWIQVLDNQFYKRQGEVRFTRTMELTANRGRILDRNGVVLATSVPVPSVFAIPDEVDSNHPKFKQLAQLLEMPVADLQKKVADDKRNFVWLKRQVTESVEQQIKALGLSGVDIRKEYKRQYPEGESVAHVVGFTNTEDTGQEGIELAFQKELSGKPGQRRVIKDRMGRVVEDVGERVNPVDGQDLQLSIDNKMQFFAYQRIRDSVEENKAKAGSVVVLDVRTGEVLVLANYPSYNPMQRQTMVANQMRNVALTDVFEPGSTMKPFVAGLALESGLVKPETKIQTAPGKITITGKTITDAHPHGILTVSEVIQKSSNVGTVKMAMQLQARDMWQTYSQAGFGQKPQLSFPGVVTGRLRPFKNWQPIEQATMSYGYGLSASLFQLARAYTVFGRDGDVAPVSLTKLDSSAPAAAGVKVFSPKTVRELRKMLKMVTGPGGTAPKAQAVGYSVGGKTGTAHKQIGANYATNKYRAWFVGLAPVEAPRIVVAVMVDEPSAGRYFGGDVAAPVFSTVVQQTLRLMGVEPDLNVRPQISTAKAVEESF
jgi:cell division protein FtsI (penicillin-binding protein 3)